MTKTVPKKLDVAKKSKAAIVVGLLEDRGGASLEALCKATGWQAHSCRAFLTGLRKKDREVVRYKDDKGSSLYRMTPLDAEKAEA